MLWRVFSMAALPNAVSAVLLIDELRRLREQEVLNASSTATPQSRSDFVVDSVGNARHADVTNLSIGPLTSQSQVYEAVVSAADATAQSVSWAASWTLDAATQAAISAKNAVSALGRQVTNEDRIVVLRSEAEVLANFQGSRAWLDLLKAMYAVGVALAAADGEITESERMDINEFVGGAAHFALPTGLQGTVQRWLASPPSIEEAFELAAKCGEDKMRYVEEVIEVVTRSDEVTHPAEVAFLAKWHALCAAAALA